MQQFGESYDRTIRPLPDQDQRLQREAVTDRPTRRARPWLLVVIAVALVAVFLAVVIAAPGDDEPGPIGAPAPVITG